MKAPFVWFGGKRRVADTVWAALGDVDNYVEPFAGSLACLLERPHDLTDGGRRAETVNDADGFLANFWRALAADPEAVAAWCDWPVNEIDNLPGDFASSVAAWVSRGLGKTDLDRFLWIAFSKKAGRADTFRYFAGCCNREIAARQDLARQLMAESGEVEP